MRTFCSSNILITCFAIAMDEELPALARHCSAAVPIMVRMTCRADSTTRRSFTGRWSFSANRAFKACSAW